MRSRYLTAKWVIAASFLFVAACQDAPEPTAPAGEANAMRDAHAPQQVADWFERSSPEVLALPQAVFADYDESTNQLVFGVEHSGVNRGVQMALSRLGIPTSAYRIVVTPPIQLAVGLQDEWRPTRGGIQIRFGNYLCTMGFNVTSGPSAERSFITNSHCTDIQGGVEGTQYYQPLSTATPVIAVEVDDPEYTKCGRGKKCRSSDASRALYNSGTLSDRGVIAKPSGPNNGSLDVVGAFTVTAQENDNTSFPGQTLNKVGRTTGWTQGTVYLSCVNVNVWGSNIQQKCQTLVQNNNALIVGGGDSGSPVFRITDGGTNVTLVGILWGSSGDNMFVFSPVKNIQDELGAFNATTDPNGGGSGGTTPEDPGPCVPKGPNGNNCK
jgi:hypothetical protein